MYLSFKFKFNRIKNTEFIEVNKYLQRFLLLVVCFNFCAPACTFVLE